MVIFSTIVLLLIFASAFVPDYFPFSSKYIVLADELSERYASGESASSLIEYYEVTRDAILAAEVW